MPRDGVKPLSVHEVTQIAVKWTRDEFEDYSTYDDVVRDVMIQVDESKGHLPDEVREALEDGRMKVDTDELPDDDPDEGDEEDEDAG